MAMRLSAFSDYSLHVPELVTIHEVARNFGISRHPLVKVVHALSSNDFLATRRRIGGGFIPSKRCGVFCECVVFKE